MPIIFGTTASGGDNFFTPQPPTIGTATDVGTSRAYNNGAATVTFTPSKSGGTATSFTATSTPGSLTGSASASPITVAGLQSATSYTFAVTAADAQGTSSASSASNPVTATTVPQAPTIGTVTDGGTGTTVSIPFTAGATGGSTITSYSVVSSPATTTQTTSSSPYTFTGLTAGTAYTFQVAATNANGTSVASTASNAVTPAVPNNFFSIATVTGTGNPSALTFSSIPSGYKSLQIRGIARDNTGGSTYSTSFKITFNGDNGSNYSFNSIAGTTYVGILAYSPTSTTSIAENGSVGSAVIANAYGVSIVDIIDYTSTTKYKTLKAISGGNVNGGAPYDEVRITGGLWSSTSAITSVTITTSNTFTSNTTFTLYGVS